jgi:hypothetical protein
LGLADGRIASAASTSRDDMARISECIATLSLDVR